MPAKTYSVPLVDQIGEPGEVGSIVAFCLDHPLAVFAILYRTMVLQSEQMVDGLTPTTVADNFTNYITVLNDFKKYIHRSTKGGEHWNPALMRQIEDFIYQYYREQIPAELRAKHQGMLLPNSLLKS